MILLWPVIGWLCAYFSTPKWMFERDPFGYVLVFFCGGLVGPLGVLWFILDKGRGSK